MSVYARPAPAAGVPARLARAAAPAPLGGFLGGVLVTQVVNGALHLAQPLLIAQLSGSLGKAAFFSAFDTAVHMAGTAAGGGPADRLGARRLLILSTLGRGLALGAIPALWLAGKLTLTAAMAAYTLDAFVRGFADTAVHTVPLELASGTRAELDRLNARYELAFDLGAVAGPALLAVLMTRRDGLLPHLAIPLGFAAAAAVFLLVPRASARPARREPGGPASGRGGTLAGLRYVAARRELLLCALGLSLLNLYPLRKLVSAFFAKAILGVPGRAGWLGSAFGLGGVAGALLYGLRPSRRGGAAWIAAGAAGTLALAFGWLPGSLAAMSAAVFFFALTNVGARLALTTRLQEATPAEAPGGVTAVARFGSNGASVGLKSLFGAAFALGAGPRAAFGVVGAGLAALAVLQLALAVRAADAPGVE